MSKDLEKQKADAFVHFHPLFKELSHHCILVCSLKRLCMLV
ncbi:YhaI family protein [Bacillus sp. FJAT-29790]|nr:YhaI family protein [Bacillus sp. FJAT-29790]